MGWVSGYKFSEGIRKGEQHIFGHSPEFKY